MGQIVRGRIGGCGDGRCCRNVVFGAEFEAGAGRWSEGECVPEAVAWVPGCLSEARRGRNVWRGAVRRRCQLREVSAVKTWSAHSRGAVCSRLVCSAELGGREVVLGWLGGSEE